MDINEFQIENMTILGIKIGDETVIDLDEIICPTLNGIPTPSRFYKYLGYLSFDVTVEVPQFGVIKYIKNNQLYYYEGNFRKGEKNGLGKNFDSKNKELWCGEWLNGNEWDGNGFIEIKNNENFLSFFEGIFFFILF